MLPSHVQRLDSVKLSALSDVIHKFSKMFIKTGAKFSLHIQISLF